jgi:hypothetical protein
MPMDHPPIGLSNRDIERLIGDVAKRHNLLLRPDDPLLITVTLNELLLGRALERIEAAIIASQDQIAAGSPRKGMVGKPETSGISLSRVAARKGAVERG